MLLHLTGSSSVLLTLGKRDRLGRREHRRRGRFTVRARHAGDDHRHAGRRRRLVHDWTTQFRFALRRHAATGVAGDATVSSTTLRRLHRARRRALHRLATIERALIGRIGASRGLSMGGYGARPRAPLPRRVFRRGEPLGRRRADVCRARSRSSSRRSSRRGLTRFSRVAGGFWPRYQTIGGGHRAMARADVPAWPRRCSSQRGGCRRSSSTAGRTMVSSIRTARCTRSSRDSASRTRTRSGPVRTRGGTGARMCRESLAWLGGRIGGA